MKYIRPGFALKRRKLKRFSLARVISSNATRKPSKNPHASSLMSSLDYGLHFKPTASYSNTAVVLVVCFLPQVLLGYPSLASIQEFLRF